MNACKRVITRTAAVLTAVLSGLLLTATAAFAQTTLPADPTGGAASQVQSGITNWITTYGAPMFAALLVLGLIFTVLMKFSKKSGKAAGS